MTTLPAYSDRKYPGEREGQRPSHRGSTPLLTVDGLGVTIQGTPILQAVDLQIARGEILALCGESGSGKSMTALAAIGLLPQGARRTGRITLGAHTVTDLPEPALCRLRGAEIGMIFQEPMTALNPVQTIGAQVAETIRIHHPQVSKHEASARAAETLSRVGMPPDRVPMTRYPHELSGGQRQRVGIAIAVALAPKLLVADEPTTALDVTTQARILDLIARLVREDGMGCLLITHDLAVVAQRAHRIAVMEKGRIVETAPTAQLVAAPQHPYTRALLDASDHRAHLPPAEPGAPLLKVDRVTRAYPLPRRTLFGPRSSHVAVKGVSLSVGRGERVGLVGESGCGKSTLTRAILGLEPIQSGAITLDGAPLGPDAPPALRRRVQVVFQDPYGSFNPRHRVSRLLTEPFHLLDNPPTGAARESAVAQALAAVGLPADAAQRHIHAFSGGQRQRLAIARALIIRPDLIVFDEAVSALDVSVRARILDLIADLSRTYGLAYLFISHDLSVVRGITDRVLVMQAGEIVEEGPTARVLDTPAHPYTQTLVTAAPHLPKLTPHQTGDDRQR
jgi:peptide/nickel transport system ATP-binding protein